MDVQIAFYNEVTDIFGPLWIGVEGVVKEENDLDVVCVFEKLNFLENILSAPHPDSSSPVDGGGAEIAVKRTPAAGHHIDCGEFSLPGNFENKIVFFKRHQMKCR
ncbi:unnamed protein product, partial [marine sediment metagenome]